MRPPATGVCGAGSRHGGFSTTCPPVGNGWSFHGTNPSKAGRDEVTEIPAMISPPTHPLAQGDQGKILANGNRK